VPSLVIRCAQLLTHQQQDRAKDVIITDWKQDEITQIVNMLYHEQKDFDERQRKIGIRQLPINCSEVVNMTKHRWTAADLSWSCLKSVNTSVMQPVKHVAATSTLVQDAVLSYVRTKTTYLKDKVSMDSLTLANNSASQKAGYIPGIHCS